MAKRKLGTCEICGDDANGRGGLYRCAKHDVCDGCSALKGTLYGDGGLWCNPCRQERIEKDIAAFQAKEEDTDYRAFATCPHCGYQDADCWEMSDGEQQCGHCERYFELTRDTTVTYSTRKVEKDVDRSSDENEDTQDAD